jgi:DNA-binding beta-propeller fold protein YncE
MTAARTVAITRGPRQARRATRVLVLLAALLAGLLGLTATASAQRGHVLSTTFGSPGAEAQQFERPAGVAIDESSGRIYVADRGNGRVDVWETVPPGTPKYLTSFSVPYPVFVAVDNSTAGSDPSKGDIYVVGGVASEVKELQAGEEPEVFRVYKFSPKGSLIAKLKKFRLKVKGGEAFEEEFERLNGVAVDGAGDVYVSGEEEVYEYTDAKKNKALARLPLPAEARPGLALDAAGGLYVGVEEPVGGSTLEEDLALRIEAEDEQEGLVREPGFGVVAKLDAASGAVEIPSLDPQYTTAVAANSGAGSEANDVYAVNVGPGNRETSSQERLPQTTIAAFTSSHQPIQRFTAPGLQEGQGIAADSKTGRLYVTDGRSNEVFVFEPEGPGEPTVAGLSACISVGEEGCPAATGAARLAARVDPRGSDTRYHFEYGPVACVSSPSTCVSTSEEDAGEGYEPVPVSTEPTGLSPGIYHYRIRATNSHGEASAEGTFTIVAAAGGLPDGREWEMVSPAEKEGQPEPLQRGGDTIRAAENGTAITFTADGPMGENVEGSRAPEYTQVLSTRGAGGWASRDITTANDTGSGLEAGRQGEYMDFSANLALAFVEPFPGNELSGGFAEPALSPPVGRTEKQLAREGKPYQEKTFYLRADEPLAPEGGEVADFDAALKNGKTLGNPGFLALVSELNAPGVPFGAGAGAHNLGLEFTQAATPDLSHGVFKSWKAEPGIYEWGPESSIELVSALPEGSATSCARTSCRRLGARESGVGLVSGYTVRNAISTDGTRVIWTSTQHRPEREQHLFVRDTATRETVQLDVQQNGTGASGPAEPEFATASTGDSRVFFTDTQRLTPDSKAGRAAPDLYVAELSGGAKLGQPLVSKLIDLTPEGTAGERAEVQENTGDGALGASEDGSYIYFAANAALAPGVSRADCKFEDCNLYVRHYSAGKWEPARLVAVLSEEDSPDWLGEGTKPGDLGFMTSRVSPNGEWLTFMSKRSLTGYDNEDQTSLTPGERLDEEVFLYHATGGELICASCNPTGARPLGIQDEEGVRNGEGGSEGLLVDRINAWWARQEDHWLAANLPGWTNIDETTAAYQSRYLSNSGRLFFNSPDALVPAVREEVQAGKTSKEKVYEYEPGGVGSCERAGGCIQLISSSDAENESAFLDASGSGDDVFFVTAEPLAPQDPDHEYDVYDAHVCNAAAPCLPPPAVGNPPCGNTEECRPGRYETPSYEAAAGPAVNTLSTSRQEVEGTMTTKPGSDTPETAVQKLARALHACRTSTKRKACEQHARAKYEPLIRAERLATALKACKKQKSKASRLACERKAHARYAAHKASSKPGSGR